MGLTFYLRYNLLIWSTSLILLTQCQNYRPTEEECRKYCFVDCDKYITSESPQQLWIWSVPTPHGYKYNQSEHTDCLTANLACHCRSRFNWKNPFLISLMIIIGIACVYGVHRVYRKCKNYRDYGWGSSTTTLAHPSDPPINTISNRNFDGFRSQTRNHTEVRNPSPEKPPEYLSPPSYSEVMTEKP